MMKKFLAFAVMLVLTACGSSGSNYRSNPWDYSNYQGRAQSAPSDLRADAPPQATYTPYNSPGEQIGQTAVPPVQQEPVPGNTGYYAGPMQIPSAMQDIPPVKVGLLLPLSGQQADLGQSMLQAAQLALFDMGYQSFELMPRDTRGKPQEAAQAAQAVINEGAQLILGPLFAEEVRAVKPVAASRGINVIGFSTDWTLAGDNTFIMGFLPFAQVGRVVGYAANAGYNRVGILAPQTEYGNAVVSAFNAAASGTGSRAPSIVQYKPGVDDLSSVVRSFTRFEERQQFLAQRQAPWEEKLKQNPNDREALNAMAQLEKEALTYLPFNAVLLPVGGREAREVSDLLTFYDLSPDTLKRLGTGLWDDTALATDKNLRGAWFAAPQPDLRRDFERRYRDLYGNKPPRLSSLAYDATALAAVLAKKGYQEIGRPAFTRNDFLNPNGFAGIDGIFRFRPDGLIERGLAVLEYNSAAIRVIDQAPSTFQRMDY